jgi:hypothetical protein
MRWNVRNAQSHDLASENSMTRVYNVTIRNALSQNTSRFNEVCDDPGAPITATGVEIAATGVHMGGGRNSGES